MSVNFTTSTLTELRDSMQPFISNVKSTVERILIRINSSPTTLFIHDHVNQVRRRLLASSWATSFTKRGFGKIPTLVAIFVISFLLVYCVYSALSLTLSFLFSSSYYFQSHTGDGRGEEQQSSSFHRQHCLASSFNAHLMDDSDPSQHAPPTGFSSHFTHLRYNANTLQWFMPVVVHGSFDFIVRVSGRGGGTSKPLNLISKSYVPYVGNGYIGLGVVPTSTSEESESTSNDKQSDTSERVYVQGKRHLDVMIPYQPTVKILNASPLSASTSNGDPNSERSDDGTSRRDEVGSFSPEEGGSLVDYSTGMAKVVECYRHPSTYDQRVRLTHSHYAHRSDKNVLVQKVVLHNQSLYKAKLSWQKVGLVKDEWVEVATKVVSLQLRNGRRTQRVNIHTGLVEVTTSKTSHSQDHKEDGLQSSSTINQSKDEQQNGKGDGVIEDSADVENKENGDGSDRKRFKIVLIADHHPIISETHHNSEIPSSSNERNNGVRNRGIDNESSSEPSRSHEILLDSAVTLEMSMFTTFAYSSEELTSTDDQDRPILQAKLEKEVLSAMLRALSISESELMASHTSVWMDPKGIWSHQFSMSHSQAASVNSDKINATRYYVLSHTLSVESKQSSQNSAISNQQMDSASVGCYNGIPTLYAPSLWKSLSTVSSINSLARSWLLTLEKNGCHKLVETGVSGVSRAMVISFVGLQFEHHHLELNANPKDLHRDFYVHNLQYIDAVLNINAVVREEDNKAELQVAIAPRIDSSVGHSGGKHLHYYGCDAGCLDPPVHLKTNEGRGGKKLRAITKFPVKLTDPVTSILYIAPDRQHMEELKHAIHLKHVQEAPPHDQHLLAMHKHGSHMGGGLPSIFWFTVFAIILIFHVFLIRIVCYEYCLRRSGVGISTSPGDMNDENAKADLSFRYQRMIQNVTALASSASSSSSNKNSRRKLST